MSTSKNAQPDITTAAVLFSRQFVTLLSAGVSLARACWILETESPPPYAEAMGLISARIHDNQTLSQAIADMPRLFPPFYRVMIRAGEVGGILDVTLSHAADMLQEEWTLSQLVTTKPVLMADADGSDWTLLTPQQRTLQLLLFCRAWGAMLSSGVPILQAMEVAAESLHARQRDEMLAARHLLLNKGTVDEIVAQLTFLPASTQALITMGMTSGELDTLLLKAAELYRHQLVYQRQAG